MIVQAAYPPTNIVAGDILKPITCTTTGYTANCYEYVGNYVNYVAPGGFITSTQDTFTATTATTYTNCLDCLTVITTPLTYTPWSGKGGYSINCPICQLTDFGKPIEFYTTNLVTSLSEGDCLFQDSGLTTILTVDYVQQGNFIYSVNDKGFITGSCRLNGNCN
jgi:hypothetical protein